MGLILFSCVNDPTNPNLRPVKVPNSKCAAACDGRNHDYDQEFIDEGLMNANGPIGDYLVNWFHENCVYTPYQVDETKIYLVLSQPENDHAWPNFYVPESNPCFEQWQIGFEDQGCDACIHDEYDNTPAFADGWSYKPLEGSDVEPSSEGKGNCTAQCGKYIEQI